MQRETWIKRMIVVVVILIMAFIAVPALLSYMDSTYPYLLAVREVKDGHELYLANWQESGAEPLLVASSQGEGVLPIQWSTADPQTFHQSLIGGAWDGGNAYLLPEKELLMYATQNANAWNIGIQLVGKENQPNPIVTDVQDVQVVSVAPDADLVAISLNPVTPTNTAAIEIFSLADGSQIDRLATDAFHNWGILSPDGNYLLSSQTITGTLVYSVANSITMTQTVYTTTYQVTSLSDGQLQSDTQKTISEFVQEEEDFQRTTSQGGYFRFTGDSKAIVFEVPDRYVRLQGFNTNEAVELYTASTNTKQLIWDISPDNKHILIADQGEDDTSLFLLSLVTGEKTSVATGKIQFATFLTPNQIVYIVNGYVVYDIEEQTVTFRKPLSQPLVSNDDYSQFLHVVSTGDEGNKFELVSADGSLVRRIANTKGEDLWHKMTFLQTDLETDSRIITGTVRLHTFDANRIVFAAQNELFVRHILGQVNPILLNDMGVSYENVRFVSDGNLLYTTATNTKQDIYLTSLRDNSRVLLMENARLLP